MAAAPKYVPYDEFLRSEVDSEVPHEWVNGEVYTMSRGTPEHGRLAGRFVAKVLGAFLEDGCESFAPSAAIFIEAAQHHTYADAFLVCGPLRTLTVRDRNNKRIGEAVVNPTLLVEVLSPSTERYDRDGKFASYKQIRSLQEYVLVYQDERKIEVRAKQANGEWHVRAALTGERIEIHGREFAVDEIYGNVTSE